MRDTAVFQRSAVSDAVLDRGHTVRDTYRKRKKAQLNWVREKERGT